MDTGLIMLIITLWAIFGALIYSLICTEIGLTGNPFFPSPYAIYIHTRLNFVFSVILSIVMFIICPYLYLFGFLLWACKR